MRAAVEQIVAVPRGRETVASKGARYVLSGRLRIIRVAGNQIEATCRGGGHVYRLGYDQGFWCSCPARGRCCHIAALEHVVALDESDVVAAASGSSTNPGAQR